MPLGLDAGGLDDGTHGMPAPAAFRTRPAGLGHLLGGGRSGRHRLGHGLAGDSVIINVASDDDSVDMVIEVLDLDENVLASADEGFSGEVEELVYTLESEELVIIRVRDFFGSPGDFMMSVNLQ